MKLQKSLVPLASLSLLTLGTAMAQQSTDLSLYGRANVSGESQKVGTLSGAALVDNQSRLGVRANRGLGNGLSVGATLEAGVNFNNGVTNASGFFAREATVGLKSDSLGQLKIGRLPASTAYFATADYVSNHNHDTGTSADALYDGPATGALKNAVSYTAPKMGDLLVEAQYGFKNGTGVDGNDRRTTSPMALSASYTLDALALGLGYERGDNPATAVTTDYATQTTVRAFYTMGPIGYGGYVQKSSGTQYGRTAYRLSAMYTLGQNEFHLNYGSAGNRNNEANTGATQLSLAYNYNLDKQTKLYALITRVNNKSGATYNPGRFISG